MQRVLPAARAVLVELQPARIISLVLTRAVRALLAGGARQCDHGSVLGLGHVRSSSSFQTPKGHGTLRPVTGGKRGDSRCGAPHCQRDQVPRRPPRSSGRLAISPCCNTIAVRRTDRPIGPLRGALVSVGGPPTRARTARALAQRQQDCSLATIPAVRADSANRVRIWRWWTAPPPPWTPPLVSDRRRHRPHCRPLHRAPARAERAPRG
jgi:hypothetical protein